MVWRPRRVARNDQVDTSPPVRTSRERRANTFVNSRFERVTFVCHVMGVLDARGDVGAIALSQTEQFSVTNGVTTARDARVFTVVAGFSRPSAARLKADTTLPSATM
jgi:hypothetical protein